MLKNAIRAVQTPCEQRGNMSTSSTLSGPRRACDNEGRGCDDVPCLLSAAEASFFKVSVEEVNVWLFGAVVANATRGACRHNAAGRGQESGGQHSSILRIFTYQEAKSCDLQVMRLFSSHSCVVMIELWLRRQP